MTHVYNTAALMLAMGLATLSSLNWTPLPPASEPGAPIRAPLTDASGRRFEPRTYRAIVSASTVADDLLLRFAAPEQVRAFTEYTQRHGPYPFRFQGKSAVSSLSDLERILALEPDLVFANVHGSREHATRLEEAGVPVFDLGEMRGMQTLLHSIEAVSTLTGRAELGREFSTSFQSRMHRIAHDLPPESRRRGMVLSLFGQQIFGAGRGSTYHDILAHAGVLDIAAEIYTGHPDLTPEEVLTLAPEVIVTRVGMGRTLCMHPGLEKLTACRNPEKNLVEIEEAILTSSGVEMLVAAERIHDAVYPERAFSPVKID